MCGCTCSSCHIITVDIYICSMRHCGTLLTRPDRRGATSVLPVGGCTSVVTGVFRWVWVAAVGLRAATCLGIAGATGGCTAGAVGACCSCKASEVDRLSSYFNLVVCVMLDSIWMTFTNVVSCSSVFSSTNDFDDV